MDLVFFDPRSLVAHDAKGDLVQLVESSGAPAGDPSCLLLKKADAESMQKTKAGLVAVYSADIALSHWAASQPKTSVLLLDLDAQKPALDRATARVCEQNKVTVGILLSQLLEAGPLERQKRVAYASAMAQLVQKSKSVFRVYSGARQPVELRDPKERDIVREFLEGQS